MPSEAVGSPRRGGRAGLPLKAGALLGVAFLHVPLAFIVLYAFSTDDKSFVFPLPGLTVKWFAVAWERNDIRSALSLSLQVATASTLVAMLLGTLAAAAVWRSKFFGREAISLLLILPVALPGIITGISLRSALNLAGIPFSFWTVVIGHATFCIVVVYNNVLARFPSAHRSLHGPGCKWVPDLSLRRIAEHRHRAAGRRHARLCTVFR